MHNEPPYTMNDLQEEAYIWEPAGEAEIPGLETLSDEYFTRVGHPSFPNHSIRIKKSKDWCDSTVEQVILSLLCPSFNLLAVHIPVTLT